MPHALAPALTMDTLTLPRPATTVATLLPAIADYLHAPAAPTLRSLGVGSGKGGTILFNCHYAAFTGEAAYYERAQAELEEVLAGLDPRTYKADFSSNFYQELAEVGELLVYLSRTGHIDWDIEPLLARLDSVLAGRLAQYLATGNLERRNGALSPGTYFLRRAGQSALARRSLDTLLDALHTLRQGTEATGYYWLCYIAAAPRAYTGLSHGSAMVLAFLAEVHRAGIRPAECAELLHYGTKWVVGTRRDPAQFISTFPLWEGQAERVNNLCLIYGDLGTAHGLVLAANALQDAAARQAAVDVVRHTLPRVSVADTNIRDASVYYGASGAYLLYDALHRHTGEADFGAAAQQWLARVPGLATHGPEYLGFSPQFYKDYPAARLGVGFGLVGIGLTLLQAESQGRYALDEFVGLA
jgi:hypothetical protein